MPALRLLILGGIVIALALVLIERHHVLRCPVCESSKIKEMERLTDKVDITKGGLLGIGSRVNVSAIVSMRCFACGHTWQRKDRN